MPTLMNLHETLRALRGPARAAVVAVALGGALAACDVDSLLQVPDPDVATPESVQDPAALPAVRAGAIGDLAIAIAGSNTTEDGMVQYTGLLTDELNWAETFPTREQIDRRNIEVINGTMEGLFSLVQRARASAERAADGYTRLAPDAPQRGEAYALAGFSYIIIAEAYCSGVPFSHITSTGTQEFGEPQTTVEMFDRAIQLFDSALAAPGINATFTNLAKVGKGRALLNLARYTEAAAAVNGVPTSFVYNLEYSENSNRQNNGVYIVNHVNRRFSPIGSEGGNGLPYRNDNDPRVVAPRGTGSQTVGFDGATPLFLNQKYPSRSAAFPLATGIEARLIEAESQLQTDPVAALATLNALRTAPGTAGSGGVAGLTPLTPQVTTAAQVDQLFKERAYWLWLTSHRIGDLRRLSRPTTAVAGHPAGYNRDPESVWPTGTFFKGGAYGPDTNFPVPFSEK
ncbi:MAG: hypothetical protein ACJ8AO_09315, partial [Gemmatimonadaceae bacterium]